MGEGGAHTLTCDTMEGGGRTPFHIYVGFFLSLLAMLCAGTLYAYGAYEDSLKVALKFTQSEVETVGIFGDAGSLLSGPFVGMFVDRFGPTISCLVAAVNLYIGYLLMYAFVVHGVQNSVLMGIFFALVGVGSGGLYISLLSTEVKHFSPKYRGMVIGFLVSMYGLSALFFITCYATLFTGKPVSTFLLFVGVSTGTVAMMSSAWAFCSFRLKKVYSYRHLSEEGENTRNNVGEETLSRRRPSESSKQTAIEVVEQFKLTSTIDDQQHDHLEERVEERVEELMEDEPESLLHSRETLETSVGSQSKDPTTARYSWDRLIRDRNFWLSFTMFFLLAGAGLTFINNTGRCVDPRTTLNFGDNTY